MLGPAAGQHLDLGDHRQLLAASSARVRKETDTVRARILEGRRYRRASTTRTATATCRSRGCSSAGVAEWRRSTAGKAIDRDGTRERLATAMGAAVAHEIDKLADRLNILATVGSVAPFVGLFGTVWGIMRSFTAIAGAAEFVARGGRAGHRRGAVRHRDRPVRGDPRGDRLQPLQPRHQPDRGAAEPLRRRLPRDAEPPAGGRDR